MILALLGAVTAQAVLGLFTVEHNDITAGPLYRLISEERQKVITGWHTWLFYWVILALVPIHILANLWYGLAKKEPLITAMITGKKPAAAYEDAPEAVLVAPAAAARARVPRRRDGAGVRDDLRARRQDAVTGSLPIAQEHGETGLPKPAGRLPCAACPPPRHISCPTRASSPASPGRLLHAGAGSAVLGRVTLGRNAWLGALSVIRADGHFVRVGDDFHLGARSTLHINHEIFPCIVGDRVAVGRNACVHACTVGSDVVIGDDVVILDGAVVEDNVVLEPGSTVFPNKRVPGGFLYAGSPAKPVRALGAGEVAERRQQMSAEPDDCRAARRGIGRQGGRLRCPRFRLHRQHDHT